MLFVYEIGYPMASTASATQDVAAADLEVDTYSALGSDISSNRSASVTSSITNYVQENGRRYHKYRDGSYYLPNDEPEQARLDLLHHISRMALDGKSYIAPHPTSVKRCLDVGTGTGIWAMDFADEFER